MYLNRVYIHQGYPPINYCIQKWVSYSFISLISLFLRGCLYIIFFTHSSAKHSTQYPLFIPRGKHLLQYPLFICSLPLARIHKWVAYSLSSWLSLFRIHLSFFHFIFRLLRGCLTFPFYTFEISYSISSLHSSGDKYHI
jgi:hypothetical protein